MPTRSRYTDRLIERAEREPDFRAQLLSNPKAAVAEELGVELPDGLNLREIEEQSGEAILVLRASDRPEAIRDVPGAPSCDLRRCSP